MRFEKIVYKKVNPDGTFKDEKGAVNTEGTVRMGLGEGCGIPTCHCSDGYWVSVFLPRTRRGVIEGIVVTLTKEEIDKFLKSHVL